MGVFGRDLGSLKREERQVDAFDQIRLDGVGEVKVHLGDADHIVVEAPEDLLDDIETRVEQGVLELGLGGRHITRFLRGTHIRFEITARSLRGLAIDGSGSIEASQLRSDSLGVSIDGAGRIAIQEAVATRLHISIDGAGRVSLGAAKARETRCQIDGAGTIDLGGLEGDEAQIGIDGHGRVRPRSALTGTAV
ncbi:MAG: DUF2807 domain-containing protein [Candidatus Bipolaricaulota bacterium]|nr:DUF2807 domain-containing protein [Candidatus Bipolaricaulota bacterium]